MSESEAIPDGATLVVEIAEHTSRANLAVVRLKAWNNFTRSLVELIAAYDGNQYKDTLKALYDEMVIVKKDRAEKLGSVIQHERAEAARKMNIYNERY